MTNLAEPIGQMTLKELKQVIRDMLAEEQMADRPHPYQVGQRTAEAWQIFLAGFIDQLDAPSPRAMLREDRDR